EVYDPHTAPEHKLFCCSYGSVGRTQWSPNDGCDDDRRERAQPNIGERMAFALAGSVLSPLSVITVFRSFFTRSCFLFNPQLGDATLISHLSPRSLTTRSRSEDSSYVVPCVLNQRDVCVSAR
ncbi:unnamed protein product, partial [Musa acuminata var. zebrina]